VEEDSKCRLVTVRLASSVKKRVADDVIGKVVVVMFVLFIFSLALPVRFMLSNVSTTSIVVFDPEIPLLSIVKLPYV